MPNSGLSKPVPNLSGASGARARAIRAPCHVRVCVRRSRCASGGVAGLRLGRGAQPPGPSPRKFGTPKVHRRSCPRIASASDSEPQRRRDGPPRPRFKRQRSPGRGAPKLQSCMGLWALLKARKDGRQTPHARARTCAGTSVGDRERAGTESALQEDARVGRPIWNRLGRPVIFDDPRSCAHGPSDDTTFRPRSIGTHWATPGRAGAPESRPMTRHLKCSEFGTSVLRTPSNAIY